MSEETNRQPPAADRPPQDFPARYDPKPVESRWYEYWESNGLFRADNQSPKKAFSIVIPPPNVTGSLHLGHVLDSGVQDIQIRLKKMQGFETLWLPGTDHASIGTHTQLDRVLAKEGKTRFDLGREEFLRMAWAWKEKYGGTIIAQLKRMGCACDWSRTRFTMDEMLSKAVREAFCRYYEDGLVYRGTRIVNWCPRCHTAISDLEVKHVEVNSYWWYIRYPLAADPRQPPADSQQPSYIVVATTRPETMLGDTAVAVNPADERYRHLVGRKLILPLTGREIPLIADELVMADFGTGAVKVTPAHDATDFEIGRKHKLEFIKVIDEDARMTDKVPARYQGLTREECRKRVIADLEAAGLMEKVEPYRLSASNCERCGTTVEPLISEQWFIRMAELAQPAIKVVEEGRIKFIPERWTKVYLDWMHNIRDWCVSRQLWWGHRIPVFYCDDCGEVFAARVDPTECPKCHGHKLRQDEDILDTWFSSALWPFSTLGWPDQTPDLAKFYPTAFQSTAPEIIFLWVARMIFSGLKFMGEIPFSRYYIHSVVLMDSGERMSRSKGVGIDPVEMFDKYGTDAVRFTIAYLESQSQSYRLSEKRFEFGRNFTNKIWNAARLLHPALTGGQRADPDTQRPALAPVDEWIVSRFNRTVQVVTSGIEDCYFSAAATQLYEFFWHEFCDWYLEFAKQRIKTADAACRWTLYHVFRGTLQLLHPMMPFITEELWQRFSFGAGHEGRGAGAASIMVSRWPAAIPVDNTGAAAVEVMRELIVAVRNVRSEMNVPAGTRVSCLINARAPGLEEFLLNQQALIVEQAKIAELKTGRQKPPHASVIVLNGLEAYIPLEGLIDFDKEIARINKDLANLQAEIARIEARLQDEEFVAKAKPEIVEREQARAALIRDRHARLRATKESL